MLHLVDLLALLDVLVVVSLTVTSLDLGSVTASVGTEVFFRLTVRDVRGLEPRNLILERVANVAGVTKTTALRVFVLKDTRFRDFFPEKGQYRRGDIIFCFAYLYTTSLLWFKYFMSTLYSFQLCEPRASSESSTSLARSCVISSACWFCWTLQDLALRACFLAM